MCTIRLYTIRGIIKSGREQPYAVTFHTSYRSSNQIILGEIFRTYVPRKHKAIHYTGIPFSLWTARLPVWKHKHSLLKEAEGRRWRRRRWW